MIVDSALGCQAHAVGGPALGAAFFFQAEDGIRDVAVTGVQTCALPIYERTVGEGQQLPAHESQEIRMTEGLGVEPLGKVMSTQRISKHCCEIGRAHV